MSRWPDSTDWAIKSLGDIATVEFSSVDKKSKEGEIPVKLCNYHDVINNRRIRSHIDFMNATASTKELQKWSLKPGDVIFTKDAEIGKVSIIEERISDLLLGYHLGRARPKENIVSGRFLAIALQSLPVQNQFRRLQTGITISGIKLGDCRSIEIKLPSLDEQDMISNILGVLDNVLTQQQTVISKVEQLRDSLAWKLLTQGLNKDNEVNEC